MASAGRVFKNLKLLLCLGMLLGLAGLVDGPLLTCYRISGSSMVPSFEDGDRVLVTSLWSVEAGDAVIAHYGGEALIKRVAALPGDSVELVDGVLFRNGRRAADVIDPDFLDRSDLPFRLLKPGEYFLLGDNRRISVDSRVFGPLDGSEIIGKVVYRWEGTRGEPRKVTAAEK